MRAKIESANMRDPMRVLFSFQARVSLFAGLAGWLAGRRLPAQRQKTNDQRPKTKDQRQKTKDQRQNQARVFPREIQRGARSTQLTRCNLVKRANLDMFEACGKVCVGD